jgi:hypothetical protein
MREGVWQSLREGLCGLTRLGGCGGGVGGVEGLFGDFYFVSVVQPFSARLRLRCDRYQIYGRDGQSLCQDSRMWQDETWLFWIIARRASKQIKWAPSLYLFHLKSVQYAKLASRPLQW